MNYSELTVTQTPRLNKLKSKRELKKEIRTLENQNTELIVSSPGSSLGISNDMVTIKQNGKTNKLPYSSNLSQITFLSESTSISACAVNWCVQNDVAIDFFNSNGQHIAGIFNSNSAQILNWEKQAMMSLEKRGELARKIILGKLKNQLNLLKYFNKYHKRKEYLCLAFYRVMENLDKTIEKIKKQKIIDEHYNLKFMEYEAYGAQEYWNYIRQLLIDDQIVFDHRERKGATDLFNCMLNYGYAILYSRIWRSVVKNRLSPYFSVIHTRRSNVPTFVFDIIEVFRSQAVDRVVIALVQKGEHLNIEDGILDEETRSKVAKAVIDRLNKYEIFRGKEIKLMDIIDAQIKDICDYIVRDFQYKPYISKW